jgi:cell wall-associated NlpC family hydrolase
VGRAMLARAMLATSALTLSAAGMIAIPAGQASAALSFNQQVSAYVKRFEGVPYRYGGTTPAGFDCSGLSQYAYRHFGKRIARTADGQFRQFRRITKARAWGGDLVFFHETSNPGSYVYHVGIYEGGNSMVDSPHTGARVGFRSFAWAGNTVTFGTITH